VRLRIVLEHQQALGRAHLEILGRWKARLPGALIPAVQDLAHLPAFIGDVHRQGILPALVPGVALHRHGNQG
jgi:hypothetical protein